MGYFLEGDRIFLREVCMEDVNEEYYSWMNDPETNQYMETRLFHWGGAELLQYAKLHSNKSDEPWFAICLKNTEKNVHIGNIKLGPINFYHRGADVSYFIGNKKFWGQGYATEAIGIVTRFAFETLGLMKLRAWIYAENIGSQRAVENNGYIKEGQFREAIQFQGRRMDMLYYGITLGDYLKWRK